MRQAGQRFFIRSCIYLRILILSYLATLLGTNGISVLMCRKAVNQSTKILLMGQTGAAEIETTILVNSAFFKVFKEASIQHAWLIAPLTLLFLKYYLTP